MYLIIVCLLALSLFIPFSSADSKGLKDCYVTIYGSVMADGALAEMALLYGKLDPEYRFAVIAAGRKIGHWSDKIDFEVEGQVVRHFKGQHLWEFNALFVARWHRFRWNDTIKTSFAVGEGLSLASEPPPFEGKEHEKTSALLNYLMFELACGLPSYPRWDLVARIHHRSGIYGLFNGVHGGSNGIGFGIRYHF